ncbi:ubiquitin-related domain-containing protein, partial [Baffinella frigidus]
MQLFVRNLEGATIVVDASPGDSVHDVKARLEQRDGVPAHQQRLAYGGRELEDERSLEESGVDREATLHVLLRLRGG